MIQLEEIIEKECVNFSKQALVLGSAPTVKNSLKRKFDGLVIGTGDVPWRARGKIRCDFWVTANSVFPLPWIDSHLRELVKSDSKILISPVTVANVHENYNEVSLAFGRIFKSNRFVPYDQRHFNGGNHAISSSLSCCKFAQEYIKSPPIQILLSKLSESSTEYYSEGSTVALHGYALAVLLQCNPIFLAGIELPSRERDYVAYKNFKLFDEKVDEKIRRLIRQHRISEQAASVFASDLDRILKDFTIINKIASKIGVKTYVTSASSRLLDLEGFEFSDNLN